MAHMNVEAQEFEERKAKRLVFNEPQAWERWLLLVKVEDEVTEAHMFSSEREARDYADVVALGLTLEEWQVTRFTVRPAPACFVPARSVVVHESRGF